MAPSLSKFKQTVWSHYRAHKRDMPWRRDTSLYAVIVSEIMLQQTQVSRVTVKFASWMKKFPDWRALAKASTAEVLQEWSGLGYNRRALYLKRIAETLTDGGKDQAATPDTFEKLRELPGIGPNTAGAILAYTFNITHPFIETNIRSTYIYFFFPNKEKVPDAEILPYIEKTLTDPEIAANPREWHWALMDYGSYLKATSPNPSRRSAHHIKQKPFKGSNRELRSKILQSIMKGEAFSENYPQEQIDKNLSDLVREGFIVKTGGPAGGKGRTHNTYRIV